MGLAATQLFGQATQHLARVYASPPPFRQSTSSVSRKRAPMMVTAAAALVGSVICPLPLLPYFERAANSHDQAAVDQSDETTASFRLRCRLIGVGASQYMSFLFYYAASEPQCGRPLHPVTTLCLISLVLRSKRKAASRPSRRSIRCWKTANCQCWLIFRLLGEASN